VSADLRIERTYPEPPSVVWAALTDRRALAEWLMPNDFAPVIGHRFRFLADPSPGYPGETTCRVLDLEPPARMTWSWSTGPDDPPGRPGAATTVSWTLVPERGGTRLVLEHTGLSALGRWQRLITRRAWRRMLRHLLPRVLRNVSPDGTFTPGAIPPEERAYSARTVPPGFLVGG
jgi:uncharacterized protein YndB with AHSA1/START domain